MKNLIPFMIAAAAFSAGCVPLDSDSPIRVLSAKAIPSSASGCTFASDGDPDLVRGDLDVSARSRYLAQFQLESNLSQPSTVVGSETLSGPERNDFIGEETSLSYTLTGSSIPAATSRIYTVVRAGQSASAIVDLLTPDAVTAVRAAVPNAGDQATLIVRFQINGHTAAGGPIRSNFVDFPITVRNGGFAGGCPAGTGANPEGPCGTGGGQDGVPACCPADATTGAVTCPGAS